jgi:hypothetical protein
MDLYDHILHLLGLNMGHTYKRKEGAKLQAKINPRSMEIVLKAYLEEKKRQRGCERVSGSFNDSKTLC